MTSPHQRARRALTRLGAGTTVAVLTALLVPLAPAQAALAGVGPVAANGYPSYYEDASGLRLRLCDDPAQGCTMSELPNPNLPMSWPDNYAGENFYYAAASADATYEAALEAAYTTEDATPGEEIIFSRIRIRLDGLVAGATYHITHPYGVLDLKAEADAKNPALGFINYTDDQGCVGAPCGDFRSTLSGFVGDSSATSMNFLTRPGFNPATAKAGDPIGNPVTPTAVTGSPFDTNFFKVEGPNAGGAGVDVMTQDSFTIEGQVFGSADPNRPSTPDLAAASDSGRSQTDNITNLATPSFTGTAAAGAQVDLLVDGAFAGTGVAAADGTYDVRPANPLTSANHAVKVSVQNPGPAVGGTLESGVLNIKVDTVLPPATIGSPRPTNGTVDPTPTFVFSSTEAGSTFDCSLTPSTEAVERASEPCVSPLTYDDQAPGTYTFRVRATDQAGNVGSAAAYTWTIASATPTNTVPSAPAIGTATAGDASATVSWSPPTSNGGSAVTGYQVQAYAAATGAPVGAARTAASTATSLNVTGLANGTSYKFTVRALNVNGASPESSFSNTVTPQATVIAKVPSAPTIGTATAGNASATVTWTAPASDGGSPITSYSVQVRRGTTIVKTVTGVAATARSTTVTGLTNGTAYNFRVRAVNAVGNGTLSAASNSVTPKATTTATVPAKPAAPTATPGVAGGAITATAAWTAPADGGSPITGYIVRALRMSSTGTVLATTTSAVQPATARKLQMTLPVTGNYRFTVQAVNAIGKSPQSARSNLVAGR